MICLKFRFITLSSKWKMDDFNSRMEGRKVCKELLLQFRVVLLMRVVTGEALRMARSGCRLKVKLTGSAIGVHMQWERKGSKKIPWFCPTLLKRCNCQLFCWGRLQAGQVWQKGGQSGGQFRTCSFLWRRLAGIQVVYEPGIWGRGSGAGANLQTVRIGFYIYEARKDPLGSESSEKPKD